MDRIVPEWRRYLLVQPSLLLLLISSSLSGTVLSDLILYRTCTTTLGLNETECSILHNNNGSEEAVKINSMVQPYASLIVMGKSFVESIFPSVLVLFLGPWSDKYGRKPLMLSGHISTTITYLLLTVMANQDIVPWYFLIAYIPTAFLGGTSVLILASICYITDITNDNERAWYLAVVEALISLGVLIGLLSGPLIFDACGYSAVFGVSTVLCVLATLHIIFFVPETIQSETPVGVPKRSLNQVNLKEVDAQFSLETKRRINEHSKRITFQMSNGRSCLFLQGLCKVFDFTLIKDLINVCFEKRDGFNRSLVWSCIACLTFLLIIFEGHVSIGYLFVNARLGWTVEKYSVYNAANVMVEVLGTIFGIKLMRKYAGFPDAVVAIISSVSGFGSVLVDAFTWQSWHMYLSMALGIFSDISRPMIHTILSKAVPTKDIGKIFSVGMAVETLLPFAAASLYTFLYSHYMPPLYPLPVWFLSAVFYVITIATLIYIQIQEMKSTVPFTPITEDNQSLYQGDASTNVEDKLSD